MMRIVELVESMGVWRVSRRDTAAATPDGRTNKRTQRKATSARIFAAWPALGAVRFDDYHLAVAGIGRIA